MLLSMKNKLEKVKEIAANVFLIWWGGWTLFVFTWVGLFGEMRVIEPNHWILLVEFFLCIGGISLGIERIVNDIVKWSK